MLPTRPGANTIPTARFLAMLTLFAITAVLNTSCNKDQNPRSDAVQQPEVRVPVPGPLELLQ
jgi:hypothetical protein